MAKNRNIRKPKAEVAAPVTPPAPTRPWGLGGQERWYCPYAIHECRSDADHRAHPNREQLLADPSIRGYRFELVLGGQLTEKQFDSIIERDDFDDALKLILARWVGRNGAWQRTYGPADKTRTTPLERMLEIPRLSVKALKALSTCPRLTPEGVLAFSEQGKSYDLLLITLMLSGRYSGLDEEIMEAFRMGPENVRVAAALLPLDDQWSPESLLKAANVTLNTLNQDRTIGIEMIEGLARGWHGSVEEFPDTIRALM